jgi:hypothetical protein
MLQAYTAACCRPRMPLITKHARFAGRSCRSHALLYLLLRQLLGLQPIGWSVLPSDNWQGSKCNLPADCLPHCWLLLVHDASCSLCCRIGVCCSTASCSQGLWSTGCQVSGKAPVTSALPFIWLHADVRQLIADCIDNNMVYESCAAGSCVL